MGNMNGILYNIQKNLKVPKGNYNSFGKYKYRSCEDIVEAVKETLPEGYVLILSDEIVMLGDRFYVKARASLSGEEGQISTYGYARESLDKKGMDDSQITGTASSYARKYALNGLFAIDDTKDADSDEYKRQTNVLDSEARDDAKLAFLKQINTKLDNVNSTNELENALSKEEKDYLKNKLQKIDYVAYTTFKKRYSDLESQFKKIAEENLLNEFNRA